MKPGDTIAITRSSGAKLKGQVLEPTDCSLVIQRPGKALAFPDAAIENGSTVSAAEAEPLSERLAGLRGNV